jgi:hypothetical protein
LGVRNVERAEIANLAEFSDAQTQLRQHRFQHLGLTAAQYLLKLGL